MSQDKGEGVVFGNSLLSCKGRNFLGKTYSANSPD
jgi:hypothetical protein